MSDQIQCHHCRAAFRVARRPPGTGSLRVACPGCGTALTINAPRRRSAPPSETLADAGAPPPPEATSRRPGWRAVDHAALFGRPSPPPPEIDPIPTLGGDQSGDMADLDETFDDEPWLSAVDEAVDEIFWVDDTPTELDRLPGAYPPDPPSSPDEAHPPTVPAEDDADAAEPAAAAPPAREPMSEPAPEPDKAPDSSPTTSAIDDLKLSDIADATTYRLRIGDQVYADIDPDDLVTLFRRGVWLIADAIAEEDGPFVPIEEHPIFERVKGVVAQSVTTFLAAQARLVPPTPDERQPAITDASLEAPDPAPTPGLLHSANHLIPWSIALITTGVASAAVTYALLSEPDTQPIDDQAAVVQPAPHQGEAPSTSTSTSVASATEAASSIVDLGADPTPLELIERALANEEPQKARQLAIHHYHQSDDPAAIQGAFDRAVDQDPTFDQQLRTMLPDQGVDSLRALGGGRSVTLRFTEDDESRYAYKVARDDWEYGWRAEVAAYHLGHFVGIDVPINEPARISRADFDELYGRISTPRQQQYADDRFDELYWSAEPGPDGVQRDYLYGTLKEWIPHYEEFPIEFVDAWRDLVAIDSDPDLLDQPAHSLVDRFDERSPHSHRDLGAELRGHTKGDIARQISNLHIFDFLMNNFDRYSGVPDFYGVNSHFRDGRFIAIDNSSGFQFRERPELSLLDRRMQPIERFERSTINALRLLHPDVIDPVLFPDPNADEEQRLDFFWEQREALLDHFDALIDEHGEEAVFF